MTLVLGSLMIVALAPAAAEPPVATGTIADAAWGVNDLNDGWVHVVTLADAQNVYGAFQSTRPDANGDVVLYVEAWFMGAVGELPYRLALADGTLFPQVSIAFARDEVPFFDTEGGYVTASPDGKRLVVRVPLVELEAAGGSLDDPFVIWSHVWYVPRNPATGELNSGGSPVRADHGETTPECYAPSVEKPWRSCPASGGFFSVPKNAAFARGFSGQNPWSSEGKDAAGTLYGASDAAVMLLGGDSSSRQAELGYKGWIDRMDWTPSLVRVIPR